MSDTNSASQQIHQNFLTIFYVVRKNKNKLIFEKLNMCMKFTIFKCFGKC